MPKIPKGIIDCVFYLYRNREDAAKGVNYGGSGFLVGIQSAIHPNYSYIYGITNWHLPYQSGHSVIRINTIDGKTDIFEFDPTEWHFLPNFDDIAISPGLPLRSDVHKILYIDTRFFVTNDIIASQSIGVGDDVFMVGRFIDHDGGVTNVPAARFGSISVMPTKIIQPNGYYGESYCIDLHSRTGFSGSPVFVYRTPGSDLDDMLRKGHVVLGSAFIHLLGIHWGQFPELWEVRLKGKSDKVQAEGMSGMTIVIPAQRIMELLISEKLKKEREVDDQEELIKLIKEGYPTVPESN